MDNKIVLNDSEEVVNRKLGLLLETGCLLMECSADTTRIKRTLKRTIVYLGLREENLHLYINYDILMVNYHDDIHSFTKFQHCKRHIIDMAVITEVSHLSWHSIEGNLSLDAYDAALKEIGKKRNRYTPWQVAIGSGFACGGFCIQFGCDWKAFFYASIAAILGFRLKMYMAKKGTNICRHRYCSLRIDHVGVAFHFPFSRADCSFSARNPAFCNPLASISGLCTLHCARSSAD